MYYFIFYYDVNYDGLELSSFYNEDIYLILVSFYYIFFLYDTIAYLKTKSINNFFLYNYYSTELANLEKSPT